MSNTLNINVSFYDKITSKKPTKRNLFDLLTGFEFKNPVMAIRAESDPIKQKTMKNKLPAFTVSGLFNGSKAESLIEPSGLICIDIDKKGNKDVTDFADFKEKIKNVPYVAYCGLSARGEGYFCIIPIFCPDKHKEHFLSLERDFARCGIIIDKACSDICRKRFVSYDPKPYINLKAITYDRTFKSLRKMKQKADISVSESSNTGVEVARIISVISIEETDMTGDYNQWFEIACSLANEFGENGRAIFHAVSQYGDYDPDIANTKYNDALNGKYDYSIGTFFHYAKEAGIIVRADFQEFINTK